MIKMVLCKYCKEDVGSYGWDEKGNIKCVSCSNWEIRIQEAFKDKNLIKSKNLKIGQKVKILNENIKGKITAVDRKSCLLGILEQYLVESKGYCSWYYPEEIIGPRLERDETQPKSTFSPTFLRRLTSICAHCLNTFPYFTMGIRRHGGCFGK